MRFGLSPHIVFMETKQKTHSACFEIVDAGAVVWGSFTPAAELRSLDDY